MDKEFVPYDQSLQLKELGFDKGCLTYYFIGGKMSNYFKKVHRNSGLIQQKPYKFDCSAPLYQQVFDWFREWYNINPQIAFCEYSIQSCNGWSFTITNPTNQQYWIGKYKSYEEAKLECLKFLITKIKNELSTIN